MPHDEVDFKAGWAILWPLLEKPQNASVSFDIKEYPDGSYRVRIGHHAPITERSFVAAVEKVKDQLKPFSEYPPAELDWDPRQTS